MRLDFKGSYVLLRQYGELHHVKLYSCSSVLLQKGQDLFVFALWSLADRVGLREPGVL